MIKIWSFFDQFLQKLQFLQFAIFLILAVPVVETTFLKSDLVTFGHSV